MWIYFCLKQYKFQFEIESTIDKNKNEEQVMLHPYTIRKIRNTDYR